MYYDYFPAWLGTVILAREIAIAVLMVGATALGMERFPVTKMGKQAAFGLMCAVPWITIGTAGGWWGPFTIAGWLAAIPGVLFSYVSFVRYLPVVRANMSSRRPA